VVQSVVYLIISQDGGTQTSREQRH